MSVNKLKVFKIRISTGGQFSLENATQEAVTKFLSDPNKVYVGHSTSVLSEDIEELGLVKTVNRFLVISLVYKDLKDRGLDLTKTSAKVKNVVRSEYENSEKSIQTPVFTQFDKEYSGLLKSAEKRSDGSPASSRANSVDVAPSEEPIPTK